ncbi:hypothetical protein PR202_gb27914 [Eleusine coracana subsp. coracana]|uniref:Uncharacterized protein n=1 Tax=Eleusine coracana subsp. coracana TaxID=191504 RepID=A0AAV5FXC6_ELECO|nr:hypothetical protein PR202_gb27914 [Eleusine coracana subsp. coracana]
MAPPGSRRWAYVRVMAGTILGGVLGFYVMHRVETSYKARLFPQRPPRLLLSRAVPVGKISPRSGSLCDFLLQARMEERLRRYEAHMLAKAKEAQQLKDEAQRDDQTQLLPDS